MVSYNVEVIAGPVISASKGDQMDQHLDGARFETTVVAA